MIMGGSDQRGYWTRAAVGEWLRHEDRLEAMARPFGQAMLGAAALMPGEWVLDVGCGAGTTTVDAARRVAHGGIAIGADISPRMLSRARQHAACRGVSNVDFVEADAQTYDFGTATFDAVISRFGMTFFDDPLAAVANLARALRSGGRLAVVVSQEPLNNELIALAVTAAAPCLGVPDLDASGAPGQFAFADGDRLVHILGDTGFRSVRRESVVRPVWVGADVDDTVAYLTSRPEARELFAAHGREAIEAALEAVRAALSPYAGPAGVVVDDAAWLVTAIR